MTEKLVGNGVRLEDLFDIGGTTIAFDIKLYLLGVLKEALMRIENVTIKR